MHDRVHRLTWHESIPPDEIWVKIGGDKGGGSFKMNFQICNLHHPNSPSNTCVFCIFEAPDSPVNLQFALGQPGVQNMEVSITKINLSKVNSYL